jgi:hypothetical protein
MAQLWLPIVDRYVSIVFDKVNEVFKSGAKLSHILLNALSVLLLRFRVALQQLDQSAYVANLVVVLLDIRLYSFNLVLNADCAETGLRDSFELHFQKGHVGRPLSAVNVCALMRQILETSRVCGV